MKTALEFLILLLRILVANSFATRHESNVAVSSSGSQPALAPMPAPKSKDAFAIEFEIHNLNYFDLSKEVCHCPHKMLNGKEGAHDEAEHPHEREDVVEQIVHNVDNFGDQINNVFKKAVKEVKHEVDVVKDTATHTAESVAQLLQVEPAEKSNDECNNCTTVMTILRESVEHAVVEIVHASHPAVAAISAAPSPMMISTDPYHIANLAPSAAPPGKVFLQNSVSERQTMQAPAMISGPAPGPQIAAINAVPPPADPTQDLEIFITFAPGESVGHQKSTKVQIAFADKAGHVADNTLTLMPQLMNTAIGTGTFTQKMGSYVCGAVGIHPQIAHIEAMMKKIELWPVQQCEKHIKEIVGHFSHHYTREQVPRALYNECTNFMTKISFSHDYVLDPLDTTHCHQATAKFTKQWEYGKNVDPEDFQSMCVAACKAKFGQHALQCSKE